MRNILEINLKIRPKNGIFPSRANNAAGTFDNLDKNKNEYKEIEKIMEELKLAVIYDNEQLVEKYDEELTDLLFDI